MPWLISHGPRSMPVRTRARGAGTRQAPCRHASHISSQEASKATESPARTRSCVPTGSSCWKIRASASTKAAAERCCTATPLGVPVEPEVKMTQASSSGPGSRGAGNGRGRWPSVTISPAPRNIAGDPGLAEHEPGPLLRVVRVHRDVRGPDHQDRQDRDIKQVGAGRDPDADLVPGTEAGEVQLLRPGPDRSQKLGVTERLVAVVEGGSIREARGGVLQDVDQGPLRRCGQGPRKLRPERRADGGEGLRRAAVLRLLISHRGIVSGLGERKVSGFALC